MGVRPWMSEPEEPPPRLAVAAVPAFSPGHRCRTRLGDALSPQTTRSPRQLHRPHLTDKETEAQTAGPSAKTPQLESGRAQMRVSRSGTCFLTLGLESVGPSGRHGVGCWESTETPQFPCKTSYIQLAGRGATACWGGLCPHKGEDLLHPSFPRANEMWIWPQAPTASPLPSLLSCGA